MKWIKFKAEKPGFNFFHRTIKILTFRAELNTTTSPGGWIHGSPSTCTGMSECEWIFMWPPFKLKSWKKNLFGTISFIKRKFFSYFVKLIVFFLLFFITFYSKCRKNPNLTKPINLRKPISYLSKKKSILFKLIRYIFNN